MNRNKLLLAVSLFAVALLPACGGGGGGGSTSTPPPTPTPVASVSITASSLSPADGGGVAANAELTVGFTFTNSVFQSATRSTLSCGATGQPKQAAAYTVKQLVIPTVSVTLIPTGGLTFGHQCTLVWLIDGTGSASDTRTVNFTVNTLKYADKVLAIWTTSAYPVAVAKTGVTPVVNKTQYTSLFNCQLSNVALSDGKIAVSCQERPSLTRRNFYIDPLKNEIYEYVGTLPANITFSGTTNNSDKPEWSAKARVADGWYFTTANITWVLNFQSDSGTVTTVKAGTFTTDGTIGIMVTYQSN